LLGGERLGEKALTKDDRIAAKGIFQLKLLGTP